MLNKISWPTVAAAILVLAVINRNRQAKRLLEG